MAGAKFTSCRHSDQVVYKFPRAKAAREKTYCCHINSVELIDKGREIQTKMSYATSQNVMPFVSELRATGHGEVWDHTDEKKLQQFGWRCTNTESSYDTKTLIGNWNEQRFDINRISKQKPIPSRYNHYFETTYGSGYHTVDTSKVPEVLKHLEAREPTAFPGHQPELDPPKLKKHYNSFLTTSRAAFGDPTTQK